jgi:acyl-CoA synthetase (AMP-forming)/AMP-acid ligase II
VDSYQIADLFEAVADAVPDRTAVVCGSDRLTYRQLDENATRLANFFRSRGLGRGDHVGTYLYNGVEYVTTMIAAFKISAVPININYRYVEEELRYLFGNADLKALVHQREFSDRIGRVKDECPLLELFVSVEDGSGAALEKLGAVDFERARASGSRERAFSGRSNEDLFIIYTGGTTGMPKGVMWPHEAAYFACFGGGNPVGEDITDREALLERAHQLGAVAVSLITAPLIHGAAQLATFISLIGGGKLVYQKRFDADEIVRLLAAEKVITISLVGDAMARPIADALERNARSERPLDCSSVFVIGSAGAIFSEPVKDKLKEYLPQCTMLDTYGSTETGFQGSGGSGHKSFGQGLTFQMNARTVVLDDDLQPVRPGCGVLGRVALRGHVPVGYYGDPEKSAETFVTIGGVRHSITGDIAEVEPDGTVKLYGRGSVCINSGGEKIFVEEVENALKGHPALYDAVVVGVDDERWGQRAVALVSLAPDAAAPSEEVLRDHCRQHVAGYKVPKEIYVVDEVFRGPNGKADYKLSGRRATELSGRRGALHG